MEARREQPILSPSAQGTGAYLLVFAVYFLTAFGSFYLYFSYATSPALIWAPAGVVLASVIWGGYRMAIPIFLAHVLAVLLYTPGSYIGAIVTGAGYALEAVVMFWFVRRMRFTPELYVLRNTLILVSAAFLCTLVGPLFSTAYAFFQTPAVSLVSHFGRAWGGSIFSVLVISPLALSWLLASRTADAARARDVVERFAAFAALGILTYLIFWTAVAQSLGIIVIFILPALLIWFALRLPMRYMTLALFASSVFGIAGSILAHPVPAASLSVQLLADEIYMGFIAAIYIVFVAVVEERRTSFRELRALYREAAEANAKKNEFIAILAHELRNPLAPLVASLELLALESQTAAGAAEITNAKAHAAMMRRLLDDILDTARLAQARFTIRKESVRFKDIVARSAAAVAALSDARHLTLAVAPVDERLFVEADPVRLTQVLMNLLINAAKYTDPGGHIDVSFEVEGDHLRIMVKDTGIGIPEEHLVSIFEPFEHSSPGPDRYGTGLGLGLYLARELTRLHGGRIEAASEGSGQGSTFTVTLPIVWEPRDQEPLPEAPPPGAKKILLVDDNEPFVLALTRLFSRLGHEVQAAYSGKEALKKLAQFTPDVIFLDIGMPEMDGYETAAAIRARGVRAPIVALSGYGQDEDRERAQQAGFDEHLVKPVGLDELQGVLRELESA